MNTHPSYRLDHIAHAVTDVTKTLEEYKQSFGVTPIYREERAESGIELVFFDFGTAKMEILAPLREKNVLAKFLSSRGPGLHHICYEVPDVERELARLKTLGHRLIDEAPRPGAMNSRIAFIHPSTMGGVLTELCDYPKE